MHDATHPPRGPGRQRSGSAILLALMALVILTALATTLTETAVSQAAQERERESQVFLLIGAETVFNEGFDWCQVNVLTLKDATVGQVFTPQLDPDTPRWNYTAPTLSLTCLRNDSTAWGNEAFLLQATVASGSSSDADLTGFRRRRVEAVIVPHLNTFFSKAMFSTAGYDVQGNFTSDSWNSATTLLYATAKANGTLTGNGDLGSNGTINVQKPSNISGDVEGNLNMTVPTADVIAPAGATPIVISGATTLVGSLAGTNYQTAAVDPGTNGTLLIRGGRVNLYVDTFINLQTEVVFETGNDQLVMYQKDYVGGESGMKLTGNDKIGYIQGTNNPSRPQQLVWITAYSGEIKMAGNSAYSAVIFAPEASFRLQGTSDFYGSLVAKVFHGQNAEDQGRLNASFSSHYDDALGTFDLGLRPTLVVNGWRPVTLAPGAP